MLEFLHIRSLTVIVASVVMTLSLVSSCMATEMTTMTLSQHERRGNLRKKKTTTTSRSLKDTTTVYDQRHDPTPVDLLFNVDRENDQVILDDPSTSTSNINKPYHFQLDNGYHFEEGIVHGTIDMNNVAVVADGIAPVDGRIIGGTSASISEADFYCWLLNKSGENYYSAGCGATLISNYHLATAAHCLEGRMSSITHAYCSCYKPGDGTNGGKTRAIIEIVPPGSNEYEPELHASFVNANNKNDVALLTLKYPIDPSEIAPAILSDRAMTSGKLLSVYGMGRTGSSSRPDVLQKVTVPFISQSECHQKYQKLGYSVYSDMICAGYDNGGKDSCQGDSGGPLIADGNKLVGIVSWGVGCASPEKPGVYANVRKFIGWYKSRVCKHPNVVSPLCPASNSATGETNCKPNTTKEIGACADVHLNAPQWGCGFFYNIQCGELKGHANLQALCDSPDQLKNGNRSIRKTCPAECNPICKI